MPGLGNYILLFLYWYLYIAVFILARNYYQAAYWVPVHNIPDIMVSSKVTAFTVRMGFMWYQLKHQISLKCHMSHLGVLGFVLVPRLVTLCQNHTQVSE